MLRHTAQEIELAETETERRRDKEIERQRGKWGTQQRDNGGNGRHSSGTIGEMGDKVASTSSTRPEKKGGQKK